MEDRLGAELIASLRAIESGTRARVATASIFAELSPEGMASRGWDTVVYDGDLGDLPLYLVTPGDMGDAEAFFRTMAEANDAAGEQRFEERLRRFYELTRQRYLAASSRSERIVTPAGTGHNFPYETPGFVIDVIRRVLDRDRPGIGSAPRVSTSGLIEAPAMSRRPHSLLRWPASPRSRPPLHSIPPLVRALR